MELHKRRKAVTEPEARYFVKQIISACQYLHNNKVIHRDLKLGNLFINDEMEIKIGDFGLATRLDYDGERKRYRVFVLNGFDFCLNISMLKLLILPLLFIRPSRQQQKMQQASSSVHYHWNTWLSFLFTVNEIHDCHFCPLSLKYMIVISVHYHWNTWLLFPNLCCLTFLLLLTVTSFPSFKHGSTASVQV